MSNLKFILFIKMDTRRGAPYYTVWRRFLIGGSTLLYQNYLGGEIL